MARFGIHEMVAMVPEERIALQPLPPAIPPTASPAPGLAICEAWIAWDKEQVDA